MPTIDIVAAAAEAADMIGFTSATLSAWLKKAEALPASAIEVGVTDLIDLDLLTQAAEYEICGTAMRAAEAARTKEIIRLGYWGPAPDVFGAGWITEDGGLVRPDDTSCARTWHPEVLAAGLAAQRSVTDPLNGLNGLDRAAAWYRSRGTSSLILRAQAGVSALLSRASYNLTLTVSPDTANRVKTGHDSVDTPTWLEAVTARGSWGNRSAFIAGLVPWHVTGGNSVEGWHWGDAAYMPPALVLGVVGSDGLLSVFVSRGQEGGVLGAPARELIRRHILARALRHPDQPVWDPEPDTTED